MGCIGCGGPLNTGGCANLACSLGGSSKSWTPLVPTAQPDRERIEFIRRAAMAYATTFELEWRDGEEVWTRPTFSDAWDVAKALWDAKPEDL